jgi:hypothetical protein
MDMHVCMCEYVYVMNGGFGHIALLSICMHACVCICHEWNMHACVCICREWNMRVHNFAEYMYTFMVVCMHVWLCVSMYASRTEKMDVLFCREYAYMLYMYMCRIL